RRVGPRLLGVAEKMSFRAEQGSTDLKHSGGLSFPTSVLAALPIESEQDGMLLGKANPLLLRGAADLLSPLRAPAPAANSGSVRGEGSECKWRFDDSRSVIDLDASGSFPRNTEIEALLTFANEGEVNFNQPETHTLSVREHHSFLALPDPGYVAREYDPRVGFFGESFQDFSQPYNQPLERKYIARCRLEKKDPTATVNDPGKPITFYLD